MQEKEKNELRQLNNELDNIMQAHQNNKRMQTLFNECKSVLARICNNESTERYALKISTHGGKMEGIKSLSTYKLVCDTCLKLKDNVKTICNKCYVDSAFKRYPQLSLSLIYNTLLLKYTKLSKRQLPIINDLYFRFESFSDLQNETHLLNLYAIAKANPQTQFALWTKNISMIIKYKAPKNVNIILSNALLNDVVLGQKIVDFVKAKTTCKHVKVFSVFDSEHMTEQNCMKKCITCLKCYKAKDKTTFINEMLK